MFNITFQDAADRLAKTARAPMTLRVFLLLPNHLSYTEWKALDQPALATELGTSRTSITRALLELQILGVVERRGVKTRTEWRLSPDFGWRGTVESYEAAADRRRIFGTKTPPGRSPIVAEDILWKIVGSSLTFL